MIYLTMFLTIIYGVIMISANLLSYHSLPVWLITINTFCGLCLIISCVFKKPILTAIVLLGLLLFSLANGFFLHGDVKWLHWLTRLTLTVILIGLNFKYFK